MFFIMNIFDLIAQGEHQQQDFKYQISSISKIAHSLSAFANPDGGRLLVGVRDNGRIAGVQSDEEIYMIDAAARSYCRPEVECLMETVQVQGKTVLIATIEPSEQRPVQAREPDGTWRAYVRVKDENIVATPVHIQLWRRNSQDNGPFLAFSEQERTILNLFNQYPEGLTLNQFCRRSLLPRPKAIRLLADFVRFQLVQMVYQQPSFIFKV